MPLIKRKTRKKAKKVAKRVAKRYWPLGLAVAVLVLLALAWMLAPATDWIGGLSDRLTQLGAAGVAIYLVLYVIGTMVLAPSPLMSIAAGVAFGWWGLPLAVAAATAGATASFALSRYFFNDTLDDWLTDRPAFRAAKRAVDEEGWRILLLLRLSPVVPFGLLNYLAGLTRLSLGTYVLWTAIGIVPGTFVDIYIGVIGANAHDSAQIAYLVIGLLATIAVAATITIKARGYLREAGVKA